jgi:hypothetical protein
VRNRLQNNLSYKMYEFIMCVTSYIICNNEGLVLRRMSSMTQEEADKLAQVNPFCQLFFFPSDKILSTTTFFTETAHVSVNHESRVSSSRYEPER